VLAGVGADPAVVKPPGGTGKVIPSSLA
jgi:hypothetical protein